MCVCSTKKCPSTYCSYDIPVVPTRLFMSVVEHTAISLILTLLFVFPLFFFSKLMMMFLCHYIFCERNIIQEFQNFVSRDEALCQNGVNSY